jgi:hypothetical protein
VKLANAAELKATQERIAQNIAKGKARLKGDAPVCDPMKQAEPEMHHRFVAANLSERPNTDEEKLNKTERAWLSHLRLLHYPWIGIQCITLKLGYDCRYTPDFTTIGPSGQLQAWETKGFFRDDAKVKLQVAARLYRWIDFVLVIRKDGKWQEQPVKA